MEERFVLVHCVDGAHERTIEPGRRSVQVCDEENKVKLDTFSTPRIERLGLSCSGEASIMGLDDVCDRVVYGEHFGIRTSVRGQCIGLCVVRSSHGGGRVRSEQFATLKL